MIQTIRGVFIETGFQIDDHIVDSDEHYKTFFAKRIGNDKFDFYLILGIEEEKLELEGLKKIMNEILEQILRTQKYPGVDKNLSLLLIVERKITQYTDEYNRKVYDFEEDPFHFKKYILPFTVEQSNLLKEQLSPGVSIIEQLDEIITNKELFSSFKENGETDESDDAKLYDLVSKVYIKLPFLKLKVNKEKLPSISKEIEREIPTEDKDVVNMILGMRNEDLEWNGILSVLGVKIDEL